MTTLASGPQFHLLAVSRSSSSPNNLIPATFTSIESNSLTRALLWYSSIQRMGMPISHSGRKRIDIVVRLRNPPPLAMVVY